MNERGMHGSLEGKRHQLLSQARKQQQTSQRKKPATFHQNNLWTLFESCEKRSGLDHKKGKLRQMDKSTWRPAPLLRGRKVEAEYNDPLIPDYQDNPLLEALPPIWKKEQVID